MQYLISIAAGLAGGIAAVLLFGRRRSRRIFTEFIYSIFSGKN